MTGHDSAHPHGERSEPILRPGNTNCGGCGMSIALQVLAKAVGDTPVQLVIPACCGMVTAGPFPFSAYGAPVVASTFAATAAVGTGLAHVARLARLGLDDDVLATYGAQPEVILEHAARVQSLDTDGVEPTAHPLGLMNGFREDATRPSLDRAEVLAQAPDATDTRFRVPPALEQE